MPRERNIPCSSVHVEDLFEKLKEKKGGRKYVFWTQTTEQKREAEREREGATGRESERDRDKNREREWEKERMKGRKVERQTIREREMGGGQGPF